MKQTFIILFVITLIVIVCYILALFIPNTIYIINKSFKETTKDGVQAIAVTFYSLILATLETTFSMRLLVTFNIKGSTNELSTSLKRIIWFILIYMSILEICFVIFTLLVGFGRSELIEWIGYIGYIMMFSYSFSSAFIVLTFARKLHDVIRNDLQIFRSESEQKLSDTGLIDILAKYLLLALFQFITTMICASGMVTSLIFRYKAPEKYDYAGDIAYIIMNIDVIINAICLYLQYSFAQKYYHKCCKMCHRFCKNCSLNCIKVSEQSEINKNGVPTDHAIRVRLNTVSADTSDCNNTTKGTVETDIENEIQNADMKKLGNRQ